MKPALPPAGPAARNFTPTEHALSAIPAAATATLNGTRLHAVDAAASAAEASPAPVNILLVDDRAENLVALCSVLEDLGQNLVTANSGAEALRQLLKTDFAVILLDVQMPEIDGFETATLIRDREKSRHTPIIFLTAINTTETHVSRGYSLGAVDYVFKPFDPDILRAKVAAFVELARKTRALEEQIRQRSAAELRLDASNSLLEAISGALMGFLQEANPARAFGDMLARILDLTQSEFGFIGEVLHTSGGAPYLQAFTVGHRFEQGEARTGPPGDDPRQAALLEIFNLKGLTGVIREDRKPFIANEPADIPHGRASGSRASHFRDPGARGSNSGGPGHRPLEELRNLLALPFYRGDSLFGVVVLANRPGGYAENLAGYLAPFLHTCAAMMEANHNEVLRRQAEEEVRRLNEDLERRVVVRTAELRTANRELKSEIAERKKVEEERARVLEREQAARAEAEAARERLAFLSEVSANLSGSLDYAATLDRVARMAVPYLADFCLVDMVNEAGLLRRVATCHADPVKDELLREMQSVCDLEPDSMQPAIQVLRTGQSALSAEVTAPVTGPDGVDPFTQVAQLGVQSFMAVPLTTRGKTVGVLSYGAAESGRRYGSDDLKLAEGIARRAVAAIENAQLFQELQEAARRKDEFLAMLAHELRNPLAAMSNASYGLEEIGLDEERVARLRAIISRQTHNLSRLVDDLLDISRITRGKIDLRKEPVLLSSVIQQVVETCAPLLEAQAHEFTVSQPPEPVWLLADPTRLEQVISNLVNNAGKYTEPGGYIELIARVDGEEVEIRVRDNGVGIAPDLLPDIFDLFTQSERSLDRSQGGLGIGLALVRSLVKMHGGTVSAHSEGPGRGSEFVVRLPAMNEVEAELMGGADTPRDGRPDPGEPRRIVLVEDNPDAAETLRDILELWGHEVRVASSGSDGLEEVRRWHPEVVLLDIGLPGMDGYEVARRLREQYGPRLLLVALTGYGQEGDRRQSAEAGFDLHLTKPVDPWELQQILTVASERITGGTAPRVGITT